MTSPVPTRRSVVRAAAWSLPAVAVAAQAPAFAASQATGFAFLPGDTAVAGRQSDSATNPWYDLEFRSASIRAGASGIAAGTLTLTFSWVSDPGQQDTRGWLERLPTGWTCPAWRSGAIPWGTTLVCAWSGTVAPGGLVPITDGVWIGTFGVRTHGTYRVQVSAPGETPVSVDYRWDGPGVGASKDAVGSLG